MTESSFAEALYPRSQQQTREGCKGEGALEKPHTRVSSRANQCTHCLTEPEIGSLDDVKLMLASLHPRSGCRWRLSTRDFDDGPNEEVEYRPKESRSEEGRRKGTNRSKEVLEMCSRARVLPELENISKLQISPIESFAEGQGLPPSTILPSQNHLSPLIKVLPSFIVIFERNFGIDGCWHLGLVRHFSEQRHKLAYRHKNGESRAHTRQDRIRPLLAPSP